ncbi:MAG TPA: 16S rRNA (uracil(1498)-N(3))-methyltransferase [Bacteroidota bacterium]|nr:16S rRNA (uracil(1498)-N(3))-methyltransferase [Bacteroidota bacterium]
MSPQEITLTTLTITEDEFSHLTHVMRMKVGDAIRAVDGAGNAYDAVIAELKLRSAHCTIRAHHRLLHEPPRAITLGAGILKNPSRFDFLVEKVVELGVSRIAPLRTERTIGRQAKVERWQKLCLAAMKQSGRCVLPHVDELQTLDAFLSAPEARALKLIAHEHATQPIAAVVGGGWEHALVCVGPEGGFSDEEIARAVRAGFHVVSLGPRRLRSETAAIISVGLALHVDAT